MSTIIIEHRLDETALRAIDGLSMSIDRLADALAGSVRGLLKSEGATADPACAKSQAEPSAAAPLKSEAGSAALLDSSDATPVAPRATPRGLARDHLVKARAARDVASPTPASQSAPVARPVADDVGIFRGVMVPARPVAPPAPAPRPVPPPVSVPVKPPTPPVPPPPLPPQPSKAEIMARVGALGAKPIVKNPGEPIAADFDQVAGKAAEWGIPFPSWDHLPAVNRKAERVGHPGFKRVWPQKGVRG